MRTAGVGLLVCHSQWQQGMAVGTEHTGGAPLLSAPVMLYPHLPCSWWWAVGRERAALPRSFLRERAERARHSNRSCRTRSAPNLGQRLVLFFRLLSDGQKLLTKVGFFY